MRSLFIIFGGFVLLGVCLGAAKFLTGDFAGASRIATIAFLVLWLLAAAFNMWFGVARAGYSAKEEFPIFLVIFGLPALTAILLK
jgi:hypothetical protein